MKSIKAYTVRHHTADSYANTLSDGDEHFQTKEAAEIYAKHLTAELGRRTEELDSLFYKADTIVYITENNVNIYETAEEAVIDSYADSDHYLRETLLKKELIRLYKVQGQ